MADRFSAGLEREWHASATVFFNDPTHFLFCMPSLAFITQQFAISSDCKVLRVWFLEDIISLFLLFFFHIQHFTQRIKMKCQRKKFQRNFLWKGKKRPTEWNHDSVLYKEPCLRHLQCFEKTGKGNLKLVIRNSILSLWLSISYILHLFFFFFYFGWITILSHVSNRLSSEAKDLEIIKEF